LLVGLLAPMAAKRRKARVSPPESMKATQMMQALPPSVKKTAWSDQVFLLQNCTGRLGWPTSDDQFLMILVSFA